MIKNAKIVSTFLGIDDHGILTCYITLAGSGWGVSVGGYALDGYVKELDKRVPVQKGFELVAEILNVVGVDSWEKLEGQFVRVETGNGFGRVTKFGNLLEDKWIDFETFFKQEADDE